MPGFLKGPLPQNYESTHVEAPSGCVCAQILDYDAQTRSFRVNVKNQFSMDDSLEFMTPEGMSLCKISSLKNFRGEDADRLNPGTEGRVFIQDSGDFSLKNVKFGFFVKRTCPNSGTNT